MNCLLLIIIYLIFIISSNPTKSQSLSSSQTDDTSKSSNSDTGFEPSLSVVLGGLTIILSLAFLLLVYIKYWHSPSSLQYLNQQNLSVVPLSFPRVSGIDKSLIESLPMFRFSTLKGSRNGLECSICLSRFEDIEMLRLLPKCKHAFHIDCVDRWLEKHSGCPLCRCKVSQEDVTLFASSTSFRHLNNQSVSEGINLDLFVEREGSTRFGIPRSVENIEEDELHKFNHRIIISDYDHDLLGKNRWSNLSSSEMVPSLSSNEPKSAKLVEKRSMSEIIVHPRFLGVEESSNNKEANSGGTNVKEERLKRLWEPIARRTIQMFSNRDQSPQVNTRSQV